MTDYKRNQSEPIYIGEGDLKEYVFFEDLAKTIRKQAPSVFKVELFFMLDWIDAWTKGEEITVVDREDN